MSDSVVASNEPYKHPHWDPQSCLVDDASFLRAARKRAYIAIGSLVCSFLLAGYCAYRQISFNLQPHPVVGAMKSGWVYGGVTTAYKQSQDQDKGIFPQIVRAHFARTEKGAFPGLEDFSTPDTMATISSLLKKGSSSYSISLSITEQRIMRHTVNDAVVKYHGMLNVVDGDNTSGTATSEVYFVCMFGVANPTVRNIRGWRMGGFHELTQEEFFSEEREATRQELLGKESKVTAPEKAGK